VKKIMVSEATEPVLNWLVAKCEGLLDQWGVCAPIGFRPSTNWAQGGPIIEREHIGLSWVVSNYLYVTGCWSAHIPQTNGKLFYASTPLIAAMRCYCCSKLGDEVDVPEELL